MMQTGLKNFYKITQHKPDAILFFRPGTGEAEMQRLTAVELKMIRDACNSLDKEYRYVIHQTGANAPPTYIFNTIFLEFFTQNF